MIDIYLENMEYCTASCIVPRPSQSFWDGQQFGDPFGICAIVIITHHPDLWVFPCGGQSTSQRWIAMDSLLISLSILATRVPQLSLLRTPGVRESLVRMDKYPEYVSGTGRPLVREMLELSCSLLFTPRISCRFSCLERLIMSQIYIQG